MATVEQNDFTQGKILGPLVKFAFPVLVALFLQDLYGAIDLFIVGRFAESIDISGVSTGSQIMMSLTHLITDFSMGLTVVLGQQIGRGQRKDGGRTIGAGIALFIAIGLVMTFLMIVFSSTIASLMNAPEEAFEETVRYIRICGGGALVIIGYNLIGSIFRGLGDSRTPLIAVAIAAVANILGDLLLVAVFHMGCTGAAIATVGAQAFSILLSLLLLKRKTLPFDFDLSYIRFDKARIRPIVSLGLPIGFQELLVNLSFLVIMAIVNSLGVNASAGLGIAEKAIAFIMIVPSAFMQSMSAFVAQNAGAKRVDRAIQALHYSIAISLGLGVIISILTFLHGDALAYIFTSEQAIAVQAFSYLKAYAIDCVLTPFLFCFIGFFNGMGKTRFVMMQGVFSAVAIRIPVAFLMSLWVPVSLFHIGLSTPCASLVQIALSLWMMRRIRRNMVASSAVDTES